MQNKAVKPSSEQSILAAMSGKGSVRIQLDSKKWVTTGIDLLAKEGIAGLRIESLAKRCGVTKGSFYWHFKDRQALLDAILEQWKQGRIRDIEKSTALVPGKEHEQLQFAFEIYGSNRNRKGMAIELAVRDWARHDSRAAAVVESVDLYRLECTCKLFVSAGMNAADAKSRSLLLYACVFGLSLMHYANFDDNIGDLKQRISAHIVSN
jgi:AcrR family transcriptional regulator